ncbi:MAG TPA: SRPBCC domain-containing protein [Candidatus Kapabacteria bacterium]|jgi:uncharacterized protein YndB with AHSA1/START domain|nr:SRPBCC domain-containing protein [Candidatus Kapabacteria bacterium]
MSRSLKFEWFFPEGKDVVWECLTDSTLISQWLMANDFQPKVGHKFEFRANPQPGWSGIVYCEVLELVPEQRLSYSWKSGPIPEKIDMHTVVTWTLESKNNGTLLRMTHEGFAGVKGYLVRMMMGNGWRSHIADALRKTIEKKAIERINS